MTRWKNVAAAGCVAVLGVLAQGTAQAAEITVLGGMGVISGIRDLAAGFQAATGHKVPYRARNMPGKHENRRMPP